MITQAVPTCAPCCTIICPIFWTVTAYSVLILSVRTRAQGVTSAIVAIATLVNTTRRSSVIATEHIAVLSDFLLTALHIAAKPPPAIVTSACPASAGTTDITVVALPSYSDCLCVANTAGAASVICGKKQNIYILNMSVSETRGNSVNARVFKVTKPQLAKDFSHADIGCSNSFLNLSIHTYKQRFIRGNIHINVH